MDGQEELAMDMVIGYRGLLGGTMVALFSHLITTDRSLKGAKWWGRGFKANWPIVLLTPVFMMGARRAAGYVGQKKEDE